jgi:hypothetical protein
MEFFFPHKYEFFFVHIFHFIYMTNIVLSFQKLIMDPFLFLNSSIFLYIIPAKVYYNMDN